MSIRNLSVPWKIALGWAVVVPLGVWSFVIAERNEDQKQRDKIKKRRSEKRTIERLAKEEDIEILRRARER